MRRSAARRGPQARGKPVVDAVLEAARAELAAMGFGALSMERVAERAGVNKTTVYRRYPTKVDLLHAALAEEKAAFPLVDHGDLRGDLVHLVLAASQFMCDRMGKCIFRALLTEPGDPELEELMQRMRQDGEREPRLLFQRAIARGELSPDVDVALLMSAVIGPVVHRVFCERQPFDRREAEDLVDVLLDGASAARRGEIPRARRTVRRPKARARRHRNA